MFRLVVRHNFYNYYGTYISNLVSSNLFRGGSRFTSAIGSACQCHTERFQDAIVFGPERRHESLQLVD